MIEKVTNPDKIVTDEPLLKRLAEQGIDKDYVEFTQDYAPRSLGKEHSPYAKFYRDLKSNKRFMVVSGLPMVDDTGTPIVPSLYLDSFDGSIKVKNNLFELKIKGLDTKITVKNDQPDGKLTGQTLEFKPQFYLNNKEIKVKAATGVLLPIDPINANYTNNTMEWDFRIALRRVRVIEGAFIGSWVFSSNPGSDIRITYNQKGDFKLKLGQYATDTDTEVIPASAFVTDEFGQPRQYPFTVSDSATFYPETTSGVTTLVWTGAVGLKTTGVISEGPYIYVSGYDQTTLLPQVFKINPATMTTVDVWTGTGLSNNAHSVQSDGVYLYVAIRSSPGKVVKIDPTTMSTVATWTGEAGQDDAKSIAITGAYIYVTLYEDPGRVVKIDPTTMTTVDLWTGTATEGWSQTVVTDGTYLYVDLDKATFEIVKIDPTTMTTVDKWTAPAGKFPAGEFLYNAGFLYHGTYHTPAHAYKIDPTTMTTSATWAGATGENLLVGCTWGGSSLHFGTDTIPEKIIEIDPSTMITIRAWDGDDATRGHAYGMAYRADYPYTYHTRSGGALTTGKVVRALSLGPRPAVDGLAQRYYEEVATTWFAMVAGEGTHKDDEGAALSLTYWATHGVADRFKVIRRSIALFDTSSLPDSAIITAATLSVYGFAKADPASNLPSVNVYATSPASHTALVPADYNIANWNKPTLIWTGAVGFTTTFVLSLGAYIYVSGYDQTTILPQVFKIDPTTMTTVDVWTGIGLSNSAHHLCTDGTYIYVSIRSSPGKVIKIDPATMATVETWTGEAGQNDTKQIVYDGTYLYVSSCIATGTAIKIDPVTMTTVDTWIGTAGQGWAEEVLLDDDYLYVGCDEIPLLVVKVNKTTMTTISTWEAPKPGGAACWDGTYLYFGSYSSPAVISKVNPVTMATVATWDGATGQIDIVTLDISGTSIYFGTDTIPEVVVEIDKDAMRTRSVWTGVDATRGHAYGVLFSAFRIYHTRSGGPLVAGQVIKAPTRFSDAITYGAFAVGYNDFVLNAAGLAAISLTGVSEFGIRNANYDVPDLAPAWGSGNAETYLLAYASEQGEGFKPKLVITYLGAGGGGGGINPALLEVMSPN